MITRIFISALFIMSAIQVGIGQQKITRYILQKDYIDYGNEMFQKTMTDLYRDVLSGKIPGYKDATLKNTYSLEEINQRTLQCEKVKKQEPGKTNEDTVVCLPLDYDTVAFWLEVPRSERENFFSFTNLPMSFFTDSAKTGKLLFYINYKDVVQLDSTDQRFLTGYLENAHFNKPNEKPAVLSQDNIRKYVLERYSSIINRLKKLAPSAIPPKLYVSDTMNTQFSSETFQKKKEWFLEYGQNFDTEKTVSIIVTEYLSRTGDRNWTGDAYAIKESSFGLGGEIKVGTSSLSDIPFFYISYTDANMIYVMFANSSDLSSPFLFLMDVSGYQLYKSIADMSWH